MLQYEAIMKNIKLLLKPSDPTVHGQRTVSFLFQSFPTLSTEVTLTPIVLYLFPKENQTIRKFRSEATGNVDSGCLGRRMSGRPVEAFLLVC
jgi:hypothetical protein